jgi:hypothetical protein
MQVFDVQKITIHAEKKNRADAEDESTEKNFTLEEVRIRSASDDTGLAEAFYGHPARKRARELIDAVDDSLWQTFLMKIDGWYGSGQQSSREFHFSPFYTSCIAIQRGGKSRGHNLTLTIKASPDGPFALSRGRVDQQAQKQRSRDWQRPGGLRLQNPHLLTPSPPHPADGLSTWRSAGADCGHPPVQCAKTIRLDHFLLHVLNLDLDVARCIHPLSHRAAVTDTTARIHTSQPACMRDASHNGRLATKSMLIAIASWLEPIRAVDASDELALSDAIRCHQMPSDAIRGHQMPSEAIRCHQMMPSDAIRCHQRPSEAIRCHQMMPSDAIR